MDFCPVCNTSRWKDSNTPGKKVPKKVLRYFPIIPRLQRLYKSSHTAKEMTWHATGKCTEPGKMQHPVDGRAWKDFDTKYLDFAAEPRNVRLGLAADGFNPFGNLSQSYSIWSVILTTYNLPPWLCMKESSFIDTYRAKFKIEFPNKDMKEEFLGWFGKQIRQRHVDNDPGVNESSELFALACGPSQTPISVKTAAFVRLDDLDIIHFDNSSDLPLSTSLNDLNNATLHIDGQSTEVDAPPDIIDVVDEDDDIIDDEDALPHDLADSDDEDLINVDDDGVDKMSADVTRSHGGDGGGKGKQKHNLGGRAAGRLHTRDKTQNLSLKEITDKKGPVPIRFEVRDKQTLMPLGDHAAHWSSYIGEVIRGVPLYYPSWLKVPKERKAALITDIGTQFDLRPHMESPDWTEIEAGIQQHLQKAYNTNKAAFKAQHWVIDTQTGTYNVEKIRRARPEAITAEEWDKYIQFWNDPRNIARAAQNRQNWAKSTRQSSATQEYPSLIHTFWRTHTVDGVFSKDEDRRIYEEMKRLEATGEYTEDEINALARGGKLRGHIPECDWMMSLFRSDPALDMFKEFESVGASGSGGVVMTRSVA
ncbi:F-box domain containing protein [Tanacetum coccineum]